MRWEDVVFLSDVPGKNSGESGLGGGGESTNHLIDAVKNARESILIQSPYLIMPEGGIELFEELVNRGVRIRISTNSLASTDNIQAFSGYQGQRRTCCVRASNCMNTWMNPVFVQSSSTAIRASLRTILYSPYTPRAWSSTTRQYSSAHSISIRGRQT